MVVPVSARCEALNICTSTPSVTCVSHRVVSGFPCLEALLPPVSHFSLNRKVGADPEVQQTSKLKFQISGNINIPEKQHYVQSSNCAVVHAAPALQPDPAPT